MRAIHTGTLGRNLIRNTQQKAPRVRGLSLPEHLQSRLEVFAMAGQNMLHHKPPKFPKNKPIKHLGSKSAF
ncbi:hypothetical protein B472_16250 [Limnohabitans sp. Rim28]|nr:hypothetical protein B472_16250 [Limnohabitans sp. Rim28]